MVQNIIFVWGSSGPNAAADAAAMPVPVIPDLEVVEGMPTATTSGHSVMPNFTVGRLFQLLLSYKLNSVPFVTPYEFASELHHPLMN